MIRAASACLLLLGPLGLAQISTPGVLSVIPGPAIQAKVGATVDAKVSLQLRPGYHVNSNTPSDAYLIPLKLTWNPGAPLEAVGITYPKPRMEKYSFSPTPLSVFSGTFELAVHFQVPATALQGPTSVSGKLRYQACNDNMCLPPKDLPVTLQVDIVK
jgi:DsbC/DsbD-like thiol-disulfide interchange protein